LNISPSSEPVSSDEVSPFEWNDSGVNTIIRNSIELKRELTIECYCVFVIILNDEGLVDMIKNDIKRIKNIIEYSTIKHEGVNIYLKILEVSKFDHIDVLYSVVNTFIQTHNITKILLVFTGHATNMGSTYPSFKIKDSYLCVKTLHSLVRKQTKMTITICDCCNGIDLKIKHLSLLLKDVLFFSNNVNGN